MIQGRCHYCNRWARLHEKLIGKAVRMFCDGCKSKAREEAKGASK